MATTPTPDELSGIVTLSSTTGTTLTPFAGAVISGSNDDTDVVTVYVLNDNASAGTLDASALPSGVSIAPSGGTLVMISGTMSTVQAALRLLRFDAATLAAGSTQSAHLTIVMSNTADGVSSARSITNSTVQNVGINVAVQNLPTTATIADSSASALFPKAEVVSASSDNVSVSVSMSDASLGAFDLGSLSGVTVTAGANGSVTLSGSAASVGTGLAALRFVPTAEVIGTTAKEVFTLAATDQVNGTTASDTVAVSITGSQSAVSLSGAPSSATIAGGASVAPFSSLSVQDSVGGNVVATVTLGAIGDGQLDLSALPFTASNGVTSNLSADGSTLVLTGAVASVGSDLQALRFVAANPDAGTVAEAITLTVATTASGSATVTETLNIASSGTAPVLSGAATTLEADGQDVSLYPDAVLSGPTTAVDATVSLSDTTAARFDQAAFEQAEDDNTAVTVTADADGAKIEILGSASAVGAALQAIKLITTTPASGVQSQEVATVTLVADAGAASYATTILVDGPALQADTLSSVASAVTGTEGTTIQPFAQAVISDSNSDDTVTVTVTSSTAGVFDAGSLGSDATLSADGSSVTLNGSASTVAAALQTLAVHVPQTGAGGTVSLAVQLENAAGTTVLSDTTITQTLSILAPPYSSDTGSDDTGHVFAVSSDTTETATLDLSGNTNTGIVVFGGAAALDLRAANTTLVLNGAGQTGAVTLDSLGNDVVWVGVAPIDCTAGGHDRFVLGNASEVSSTVSLHGGTAADSSEFDVWGDGSEVQTITTDGISASTVFAGAAALDFTGGNATLVLNGEGQTGAVTIHSLGDSTVWAGTAELDFFEGAGSDTVILTGSATTTIHGATTAQDGTTTVMSFGSTGQFTYDGGDKAASLSLMGGGNTVHAGGAAQTVTMAGSGSLLVSDDGTATGAQTITMAQNSTATLQFIGGGNPALLVLGAGAATIDAGSNTTITGGTGAATVDLSDAVGAVLSFNGSLSGAVEITGFDPSRAAVTLSHVTGSTVQNGSLVVSFSDGNQAVFQGYADASHTGISFG